MFLTSNPGRRHAARGITLIEVMIAIVITAFGLLALAGMMARMQQGETEAYQRSQALALIMDMTERLNAAMPVTATSAQAYTTGLSPIGTGDALPTNCAGQTGAALDLCEWSQQLKGASELQGANNVGGIIGARGCIELLTPPDPTQGVCTPATYRVSVIWQGLVPTVAPTTTCGQGLYGSENQRRALGEQITVGLPDCT